MPSLARIRHVRPEDLGALYDIALLTGDSGQDATAQYRDGRLLGHLYATPYAILEPDSAFVVEDARGVAGYIVGAFDTLSFEARLEAEWWPKLRGEYPFPTGDPSAWTADEIRAYQVHRPRPPPKRVTDPYPSHLHINLLPRLQGQGFGKRLIDTWLARMRHLGSRGVHLGVSLQNARATRFYRAYGFTEFQFPTANPNAPSLYFVTALD